MYQIASKRLSLDDVLSNISGIQFFFSCVTCVTTNAKSSEDRRGETYPAIAYFIVYRQNDECNETTIFAKLHNEEVEPDITPIRVRVSSGQNRQTETAAKQLFQVIKDHNKEAVQEMLDFSNVYCYQEAADSSDDPDSDDEDICPNHFPTVPCAIVVVNQREHCAAIQRAVERLRSDGLVVDIDVSHDDSFLHPNEIGSNEVSAVIKKIEKTMKLCDHALYRSHVYAKPDGASFTYVRMMDVASYLHKLLANQ